MQLYCVCCQANIDDDFFITVATSSDRNNSYFPKLILATK